MLAGLKVLLYISGLYVNMIILISLIRPHLNNNEPLISSNAVLIYFILFVLATTKYLFVGMSPLETTTNVVSTSH